MKEVVVISGKGGTGKTSIAASFSVLGGRELIVGDCDVDADDMHLLLNPDYAEEQDFYSGYTALIDSSKCIGCGKCMDVCRFKAVEKEDNLFKINALNCEGCSYCKHVCPENAVIISDALVGKVYRSKIKTGTDMIHARLRAGADNSGKLVAKVKKDAKELAEKNGIELVLIDGSPGIGCPVVSSLTGADYVIMVTEPTLSGIHDLKRVYELVKKFRIEAGLIINKKDLNPKLTEELELFANDEGISIIGEIPYNEDFTRAITKGITAAEFNGSIIKEIITDAWRTVTENIYKENL